MENIKVLLVEDNETAIQQFKMNLSEFNSENTNYCIDETIVENYEQALKVIDKTFDAIILDLALNQNHQGGNDIAKKLEENNIRVPILFVSGNHGNVQENPLIISKRSRDDGDYEDDFYKILEVYKTGLTNILGGRGEIEKKLSEIFKNTVIPELEVWIKYALDDTTDLKQTEKALLRLVVNHLTHLLEDDEMLSYPEEFYVYPVKDEVLRTGTLLKSKKTDDFYISLSPACDLAQHNGKCKTDRLLIAEIEPITNIKNAIYEALKDQQEGPKKRRNIEKQLSSYFNNNYSNYYHSLPKIQKFPGGFINFRKAKSLTEEEVENDYEIKDIQISSPFVKDILSRFSSYYARQGQPVILFDHHIRELIEA
ncbi:Response regulator of citrate/malate metabolism [Acinetobacter baumannii]|uniref:response regulator transcription factor n=1 Tax=Acinetobacter baumannii TaxID=470 RepID=UPI000DE5DDE2|nr:response regulator transcription factor [Acinetobacter baumannii]SSV07250.1 Response regulator of citrate/malate metabolism [Acinetobacter baumannii]SSV58425.1 Response regulator of citrate/malate metabolism [Acinetobacter baumannii]SSV63506.1 Response regulator of citrate/malate metabolism [Acinetobacter baumannii]SSV68932.1 Response regulator of citrate/malate metabolism [Acinetobacter baumannii]